MSRCNLTHPFIKPAISFGSNTHDMITYHCWSFTVPHSFSMWVFFDELVIRDCARTQRTAALPRVVGSTCFFPDPVLTLKLIRLLGSRLFSFDLDRMQPGIDLVQHPAHRRGHPFPVEGRTGHDEAKRLYCALPADSSGPGTCLPPGGSVFDAAAVLGLPPSPGNCPCPKWVMEARPMFSSAGGGGRLGWWWLEPPWW